LYTTLKYSPIPKSNVDIMSLIIARKENNDIIILSDTKLSENFEKNESIRSDSNLVANSVLKTVFVKDNICISYAGGEKDAADALDLINEKDNVDEILTILLASHNSSIGNGTDYIVCEGQAIPKIYVIKDSFCIQTNNAWIGDSQAYEKFDKFLSKIETPPINKSGSFINIEGQMPSEIFSEMSSTFDYILTDDNYPTVGGFKNIVLFTKGFFSYHYYMHMYKGVIIVDNNSKYITHGTAAEGDYTISFYGASKDLQHVAFHIRQADIGIVYSRKNKGFLYPKIINKDELDFADILKANYAIIPLFNTQDKFSFFLGKASAMYEAKDLFKTMEYLGKAFAVGNLEQKAEVLFTKGVIYTNNNKHHDANECFQQAISINRKWAKKLEEMKEDFKNRS
jgi:hypothetical protein